MDDQAGRRTTRQFLSRLIHHEFRKESETLRDSRCFMRCSKPIMNNQEITQWVNRKDAYLNQVSIVRSRFWRPTIGLLPTRDCFCCERPTIVWASRSRWPVACAILDE